ncbi:MAG: GHKL domain-containing protein, partial [Lachnospiraceae bacterium]|nr:GHKL domain-containing protein [Lachnospiraceae bacterium]
HFLSRMIAKPVEENIEAQKRFVADASHELKTPLAVIDANVAVLEQSLGDNKWLGYIQEQSGRMAELVGQLLQLSHLEEGEGSPETLPPAEPLDGAEAVMTAALPFESLAFEGGLSLEMNLPENLPMTGRRQDLEQLTAILIDNGIRHASEGGAVQLSLERQRQHRGRKEEDVLLLRVSNPGTEIPPEALPHLFDRFYQIDPARSHQKNSYGLGLAIAKKLAERNRGTLQVQSREGMTTFSLLLPLLYNPAALQYNKP